jgi:repressor LexA
LRGRDAGRHRREPSASARSPRSAAAARAGEIVVAMIEGEATVKRYFPEGDVIRFQPANCNMQPILVRRDDFKSVDIIGVVVGVYRKL